MKLESQPDQPEVQAQSVVWQGNEYEDQNFEPDPEEESNEPDVREQAGKLWRWIKITFHSLIYILLFLLGARISWLSCTSHYQNEATKAGVAHWVCDPTTGERTFQWNEKISEPN